MRATNIMDFKALITRPVAGGITWVILLTGGGLLQLVTFVLGMGIWDEWHSPEFLSLGVAIAFLNGSILALYVVVVLIAAKFPEDLNERAMPTHVRRVQMERPKPQEDGFGGTRIAA